MASFFTRDLQMDWRLGAEHFEEYLLDHDPASNWGNWNYVAGVGSDPREDRYFNVRRAECLAAFSLCVFSCPQLPVSVGYGASETRYGIRRCVSRGEREMPSSPSHPPTPRTPKLLYVFCTIALEPDREAGQDVRRGGRLHAALAAGVGRAADDSSSGKDGGHS